MRILVVSGSSGGHIFPAVAFLETLTQDPAITALLVLPKKTLAQFAKIGDYNISHICVTPISAKLNFKNLAAVFNFALGCLESLIIFLRFRPNIVIGFGSIASVPLVLLAWLFRTEAVLHEQNVIPGLANRFLAPFADKIAVSFSDTKQYLRRYQGKIILTGNPLRKNLLPVDKKKALDFFGFQPDKFTLLVCGGSQGSASINKAFLKAAPELSSSFNLQIIHLTGENDYENIKAWYRRLNISAAVSAFLKDMQYAYSAAGLIVSRAGAATITELALFRVPAIICPYPYAYQHQKANAEVLSSPGAAVILQESQLAEGRLAQTIKNIISDPQKLESMRNAYNNIAVSSVGSLAKAVMAVN